MQGCLFALILVVHERDRRRKGVILAVSSAASQYNRTGLLGKLRIEIQTSE
jgi:hypothetical protein